MRLAAGDPDKFFGDYVDVIETKDYVDEDADVMKRLGSMFSFLKKKD